MTTACDKFFSLPELLVYLLPFLPKPDLLHLLQTNRTLKAICTPAWWKSVDVGDGKTSIDFICTPEALRAFGNNVHFVQSFTCNTNFSWYYISAVWTYLNSTTATEAHRVIPTDALSHPNWGRVFIPSHIPAYEELELVPLPPLLHLTHYTRQGSPVLHQDPNHRLNAVPFYEHDTHQHHIFWLLRLNRTTLTHLHFDEALFLTSRPVRDFLRTVSQLDNLRTLRLGFPWRLALCTAQVFRMLFFSCPKSLVELKLWSNLDESQESMNLNPEESDWDFEQGPLELRQQPLYCLKTLELPLGTSTYYPVSLLCSILQHCPVLQSLHLPFNGDRDEIQTVSRIVWDHCPGVTDLSLAESNDELLKHIMEQAPRQQLESISMYWFFEDYSMAAAISRHSETLRKIDFPECEFLEGATLRIILTSCRGLEILKAQSGHRDSICLQEVVGAEWTCTRLRLLEIAIEFTWDGREPGYMTDPTMATWTEKDHHHWKMLDKFYTQVGSLVELEVLNIKSRGLTCIPALRYVEEISFQCACLPGLLALEDVTTGQLGFLSRLSGLKSYKTCSGRFYGPTRPE